MKLSNTEHIPIKVESKQLTAICIVLLMIQIHLLVLTIIVASK